MSENESEFSTCLSHGGNYYNYFDKWHLEYHPEILNNPENNEIDLEKKDLDMHGRTKVNHSVLKQL